MSSMRDLYQETILDHGKSPRHHHVMEDANREAEGDNPLCGDQLTMYLKTDGELIEDVSFKGEGCAISQASASILTQVLPGRSREEARELADRFKEMLTRDEGPSFDPAELEKLQVFLGVRDFPTRVKCATLAWHTLEAALEGEERVVTTES